MENWLDERWKLVENPVEAKLAKSNVTTGYRLDRIQAGLRVISEDLDNPKLASTLRMVAENLVISGR